MSEPLKEDTIPATNLNTFFLGEILLKSKVYEILGDEIWISRAAGIIDLICVIFQGFREVLSFPHSRTNATRSLYFMRVIKCD